MSDHGPAETRTPRTFAAPDDPQPRHSPLTLDVGGVDVVVRNDRYSDRIRCDHPRHDRVDPEALGRALLDAARRYRRGRVVALVPTPFEPPLLGLGFRLEATMPGYYGGEQACSVLGAFPDERRGRLADIEGVQRVRALLETPAVDSPAWTPVPSRRATPDDAPAIAARIAGAFEHYPTPSGVSDYVAGEIAAGIPFRVIDGDGGIAACASADLVRSARTAELTDCVTAPAYRGRGLMQSLLRALADDLRALDYPTAYTLARASVPGVNRAFQRTGYRWRGRMSRSCRIGGGLEDMNVWSRKL